MIRYSRRLSRAAAAILCGTLMGWQTQTAAVAQEAVEPRPISEAASPVELPSVVEHAIVTKEIFKEKDCCKSLGTERNLISIFEIDPARPMTNFRIRMDGAYGYDRPDRAEYFFARQLARGPQAVNNDVNYQDLRFYYEAASDFISLFTDLPIRSIDPSTSPDTTGFADMNAGIKSRLLAREKWELTTIFRTYIPTGSARKGLGTGHVSLEPGLLGNYRLNCKTYLHGEFKFWFPIGGSADFAGNILRYGTGVSHVLWESCDKPIAIIPTLEFVGWTVLDGRQTNPGGIVSSIDGMWIVNIQPGIRTALGKHFDIGLSGAWNLTNDHWYNGLGRLDLRWVF